MGSYSGFAAFIALNICKSQLEVQLYEAATKPCKARVKRLDSSFLSSTNPCSSCPHSYQGDRLPGVSFAASGHQWWADRNLLIWC